MGRFRLFVALMLGLATAVGVAQEKTATEAPAEAEPAVWEPSPAPGRSNPFAPLDAGAVRRPWSQESPLAGKAGEVPTPPAARVSPAEGLKLNGILYCDAMPLAVVNDLIVRVGDEVGGMRVKTIEPNRVLLEGTDGFYVMTPLSPSARPAPVTESAEGGPDVAPAVAKTEAGEEDAQGAAGASPTRDQPMGKENP